MIKNVISLKCCLKQMIIWKFPISQSYFFFFLLRFILYTRQSIFYNLELFRIRKTTQRYDSPKFPRSGSNRRANKPRVVYLLPTPTNWLRAASSECSISSSSFISIPTTTNWKLQNTKVATTGGNINKTMETSDTDEEWRRVVSRFDDFLPFPPPSAFSYDSVRNIFEAIPT